MKAILHQAALPALPPPVGSINVNFCKNPACANFGIPAVIQKHRHTKGTALATTPGTAYRLVANGKNRPSVRCGLCNESFSIKSNQAVAEELTRFSQYLNPSEPLCCDTVGCANGVVPVETKGAYYRHGQTAVGAKRYRCRLCSGTVSSGGKALKRQRITHHNKTILLALTNKMPLRRIAKVTGVNVSTLYGKIDFLQKQCLGFAASREKVLQNLYTPRLYISVDRQEYVVNWSADSDRRNIRIRAVGSADNASGYVFGMHTNFDKNMEPVEVEEDAAKIGDNLVPHPHRKYSRVWLGSDYEDAVKSSEIERDRQAAKNAKGPISPRMSDVIEDAYEAVALRDDSEISDLKDEDQKLPDAKGMQVHDEYALYGHFAFLKQLLPAVEKLRFFLDQDSGMRAACVAAFADDVKSGRVDAFFVRTAKVQTVDKKKGLVGKSRARFNAAEKANPSLTEEEVKVLMMKTEIAKSIAIGQWLDRWCEHPLPTMSEPSKSMCWLTKHGAYTPDHEARLYLKASMAGIDNFFQRVRRSINSLERPIGTASKGGRTWYGYSPYNPVMVEKFLDIYRTMANFVEVGKDGRTPAMRLGLAKGIVDLDEILYFVSP